MRRPALPTPASICTRASSRTTGSAAPDSYLHVRRALTGTMTDAAWLHSTRELRLTDHSAVTATLTIKGLEVATRTVGEPDAIALF